MDTIFKYKIVAHASEYKIPPINDALVLGKDSAIGATAMRRAIDLLTTQPYEHITMDDEIIGDLLVRQSILRRLSKDKIIAFVLKYIKQLMDSTEILHLSLDAETRIEIHDE